MISGVHIPVETVRTGDIAVLFMEVYQEPSVIPDTQ